MTAFVLLPGAFVALLALESGQTGDLERVKSLYIAAAYEDALSAMPAGPVERSTAELEQYRALCLLALGREEEAIGTVERLIRDHPAFEPEAGTLSPRMTAIFEGARTRVVPELAKAAYVDARKAYDAKDPASARAGFERTISLIDSLPLAARADQADLRLLAQEFLGLSAEPAPPPDPVPTLPVKPDVYVPPVAVRESLPPWNPPDPVSARMEYLGVLRLDIDETGRVTSATVVKPTHPAYDAATVAAARHWVYTPATRNGRPVAAQKDLQIRLRPR